MAGEAHATAQDLAFRLLAGAVGSIGRDASPTIDIPAGQTGEVARELLGIATIAVVSLAEETGRDEHAVLCAIEDLINELKRGDGRHGDADDGPLDGPT